MSNDKMQVAAKGQGSLKEMSPATLEALIASGNLNGLTPAQCVEYYRVRCELAGLDPTAQPFEYLVLQGKKILYAKKGATDQLSSIHGIRTTILSQVTEDDLRVVTVRATARDGRETEDVGAVPIGKLQGEQRANAMMKAVTKAKRRAVLSLCGLGMMDESEVESIPDAQRVPSDGAKPKTLQEAAGRAQAQAEAKTVRTVDVQPVAAQDAVDDPRPADADTGVPALEPVSGLGYRYAGVIIPSNVADAPARWMHYKIETKVQAINGKLWSDMPLGEIGGGRHSWLVNVVKWGADLSAKGETVPLLVARAAYCLFLIEKAAYDAAESAKRESEWVAAGGPPSDDPNAEDTGTPFT